MTPPGAARRPDAVGRVLVIEDDAALLEAVVVFLESEGFPAVPATNGREALAHLRAGGTFCLILLDLFMPEMDGWAFRAEQLRDPNLGSIPVVVISADSSVDVNGKRLGAVASLRKPIDFDLLLNEVSTHC